MLKVDSLAKGHAVKVADPSLSALFPPAIARPEEAAQCGIINMAM